MTGRVAAIYATRDPSMHQCRSPFRLRHRRSIQRPRLYCFLSRVCLDSHGNTLSSRLLHNQPRRSPSCHSRYPPQGPRNPFGCASVALMPFTHEKLDNAKWSYGFEPEHGVLASPTIHPCIHRWLGSGSSTSPTRCSNVQIGQHVLHVVPTDHIRI